MRVLYAGFDGLGLDVFKMDCHPTFRWMMENGNWGLNKPKIKHTFPSWTSINTGMSVAVHGMDYNWRPWYKEVPDRYAYIWDYFHNVGMTCGVLNFPITYPPRDWLEDRGWMMCGYPSGVEKLNYRPLSLPIPDGWCTDWVDYVKETYTIPLERPATHGSPLAGMETADALLAYEQLKLDFLVTMRKEHVLPNVDFLAVQIPAIDRIGHEMIKPELRGHDQREPLPPVWAWVDQTLAWLIDYQEPDYICLASDHGMDCELHTYEGVWALSGPGVAKGVEVPLDNWRFLPSVLAAVGLLPDEGLSSPGLVEDQSNVEDRLRALGYME